MFTTDMPGTGKTRSLPIACVMTAVVAQQSHLYTIISTEPVKSVVSCLDELLSTSHNTVRAAFRRTPADEEAKRGTTRLDLVGHVSQPNSLSNVWMIALTYGKLESGLAINADKS